ncbi:apoptosis facilitator Bcl-2-like protein 14 [Silurus meridionalis]|uniref:Apoptosis facilitator Bcl-2-like protein 14 n=1 Tax=Silurus meridionalis TaxID=175797 RepID=A0A8T0B2F0_SILME|nr:apoptosis facilitator Bcl-2-like protein 14 [Silurus meridionalis]KAF7699016.1 hypothetical protein HF521_003758 [Silurus meridionalis]
METMQADGQFTTEYKLLKIYHKKRKQKSRATLENTLDYKETLVKDALPRIQAASSHKFQSESVRVTASGKTAAFDQVADKLTHIVDHAPPVQDQVVTDHDAVQRLVSLLKEYGDLVNEKIVNDEELLSFLQGPFSYSLFEKLASAFIYSMVPPGKQKEEDDNQKKIAWTFEMTSRLSTLDLQPMNRVMGFGAQYVHQHFAPWIQQHGGWENAFESDEDVQ